jgi:lactoylglutathione lyase
MFSKLFAVCLLVNDFQKSFNFYTKTLGLKVNSSEGKFANFKLGETELAIFEKGDAVSMFSKEHMGNGGGVIIGFHTNDVFMTCEKLKAKGIDIFEGPKKTPWGQKVAYFKDPDNNIWEISEP